VGAKYEIYKLINELVEQGHSILMISSEMEELMGMSDRILVLAEHEITGELQRSDFNEETIMAYASAIVDNAG
jgi:ribose transport system ATP-binding protein